MAGINPDRLSQIGRDLDQYGTTRAKGPINVPQDLPNARGSGGMGERGRSSARRGIRRALSRLSERLDDLADGFGVLPEDEPEDNYTVADIPGLCDQLGIDYQEEFGNYNVAPLDDRPENYGQGPSSSTRVLSHQFVPDQDELLETLVNMVRNGLSGQFISAIPGDVYVQWRNNQQWSIYNGVPLSSYREFRGSSSKGSFFKRGHTSGAWDIYYGGATGAPPLV